MEYKDYYQIMGLPRNASQQEIKRAYRKLARKYHPDVSREANAEAHFKEVGEAYEVLKDPEKRQAYDQLGENWKTGQHFQPPPDWDKQFSFHGGSFTGADAEQFSDFFGSLFGRGNFSYRRQQGFQQRGEDLRLRVMLELEDAYLGANRSLQLQANRDNPQHPGIRQLNVNIPKGVYQGQQIRLAGQGEPGSSGAGDLYLEVTFNPHPLYSVEQKNVFMTLPLAPWEAALGGPLTIPTPTGKVELNIPAASANGRKLKLAGRGIPAKPPGDLIVTLQITLPPADNESRRQAYRQFAAACPFNPRRHMGV